MEANKIKISTLIIALLLVAAVEIIVGAVIEGHRINPDRCRQRIQERAYLGGYFWSCRRCNIAYPLFFGDQCNVAVPGAPSRR